MYEFAVNVEEERAYFETYKEALERFEEENEAAGMNIATIEQFDEALGDFKEILY